MSLEVWSTRLCFLPLGQPPFFGVELGSIGAMTTGSPEYNIHNNLPLAKYIGELLLLQKHPQRNY
jgi:hypothetical protein